MEFAFGFLLFIVGFVLMSAGIGLFIGGEITLKSGTKIPKLAGRKAGIAFVSFFPLVGIARLILRQFDPDRIIPSAAVYWPLALVCMALGAFWLLRGMAASKPRRILPATIASNAFAVPEPAESAEPMLLEFDVPGEPLPPPAPPMGKPARSKPRGQDPFDFG